MGGGEGELGGTRVGWYLLKCAIFPPVVINFSIARFPGPAIGPYPGTDLSNCIRMNDDLSMEVSVGLYF